LLHCIVARSSHHTSHCKVVVAGVSSTLCNVDSNPLLPNRAAHHISATRTCVHSATIHHYQASVLLSPGSRASPCVCVHEERKYRGSRSVSCVRGRVRQTACRSAHSTMHCNVHSVHQVLALRRGRRAALARPHSFSCSIAARQIISVQMSRSSAPTITSHHVTSHQHIRAEHKHSSHRTHSLISPLTYLIT
jgi:hypothetical protein